MAPACTREPADPAASVGRGLLGHDRQIRRPLRQIASGSATGCVAKERSSAGIPTSSQVGHGDRGLGHIGPVHRCVAGLIAGKVFQGDLIGGGSMELARHHQHLAGSAERTGFPSGALDRLGSVTDEVPVRGLPHLAGPATAAKPPRAHRAATSGVRLVLDEQFPPSVGNGPDVVARYRYRQRRTRPSGHLLHCRQSFQHRTPHPAVHQPTSSSPPDHPESAPDTHNDLTQTPSRLRTLSTGYPWWT